MKYAEEGGILEVYVLSDNAFHLLWLPVQL